jgi:NAD(P)-dependent dehydrogenase (short-subunit alcohol dehydrogenase family)
MNKVAVITGGAGGMGLATARIMGKDHAVLIADVDQARLDAAAAELGKLGIESRAVVCDITDRKSVDALAAMAQELGKVVSVVHTAGVSPSMGAADMIIRINALGTINIAEAFHEIASEGFALVNVASMAAYMMPGFLIPKGRFKYALSDKQKFYEAMVAACKVVPGSMRPGQAYSISKNFVIWYSKAQAGKFGKKGARVVSVSPGSFDTAMGKLEEKSGAGSLAERSALGRFGRVEEIAEVLAFCASDKPGYLTGTDILVDGGTVASVSLKDLLTLWRKS